MKYNVAHTTKYRNVFIMKGVIILYWTFALRRINFNFKLIFVFGFAFTDVFWLTQTIFFREIYWTYECIAGEMRRIYLKSLALINQSKWSAQCVATLSEINLDTLVSTLTRRGHHERDRLVKLRREKHISWKTPRRISGRSHEPGSHTHKLIYCLFRWTRLHRFKHLHFIRNVLL